MNALRIVFMGTPEFAVATLKSLVTHNYKVVGVITAPDRPAGRGRKLQQSAVKTYAQSQELTILQPTNLKDPIFLETLKELNANLQIVVAFRMLPKLVWAMPNHGTFNLHASLLPNYRGAAPINWAIINGETKTGLTTFFIDDKIDTGAIILQEQTQIAPDSNVGELHDLLMAQGAQLSLKTVALIEEGNVTTQIQPIQATKTAYKIHKDTCKIDWNKNIDQIYNHIRGLSPYPAAWTHFKNGEDQSTLKIFKTEKRIVEHSEKIGSLHFTKNNLEVAITEGYLSILELQLAGKRRMNIKEALNGLTIKKAAIFL